jgi:hypothetical protein
MIFDRKILTSIVSGIWVVGFAVTAHATTMGLSFQDTASGSIANPSVVTTFLGSGSAFYGDTFTAPTTPISGSPSPGYGFYDDFYFSVPSGVAADSITSTIDLGSLLAINGLQVRLYDLANNPPPVLGTPAHGTLVSSWSTSITGGSGMTGDVEVLNTTLNQAGTYVLEVRGNVSGSSGGSYSGTLNIAPVPLPAALPLMLSALGMLGAIAGRRRRTV